MKEILFKILVVLLSPIYFMFWIFANTMEIGQPILDVVLEKVEKMSSFWKEFFKGKNK